MLYIEKDKDNEPYYKKMSDDKVINITGEGGSGKSTYVSQYKNDNNYIIVDYDNIFVSNNDSNSIEYKLRKMLIEKYGKDFFNTSNHNIEDMKNKFSIIYDEILKYLQPIDKTIILDGSQLRFINDVKNIKGEVIVLRTSLDNCLNNSVKRYIEKHPGATEEDITKYRNNRKKILEQLNPLMNDFLERIDNYSLMVTSENLYNVVKKQIDDQFLNDLFITYFNISKKEFDSKRYEDLEKIIYEKINLLDNQNSKINPIDKQKFFDEVYQDMKKNNPNDSKDYVSTSGWDQFKSWHLNKTSKFSSQEIAHRFYIGLPAEEVYNFASILYHKYKNLNIPFYFKINEFPEKISRRDTIVIYTTTSLLEKNLKLIQSIGLENPNLVKKAFEPSILMGKVNNWLGYATEYENHTTSYTAGISNCLSSCIFENIENWVNNHQDTIINYKNENIAIKDFYSKYQLFDEKKIKTRLLLDMLFKTEPSFKYNIKQDLRKRLIANGYNEDNICFDMNIYNKLLNVNSDYKKNLLQQKKLLVQQQTYSDNDSFTRK